MEAKIADTRQKPGKVYFPGMNGIRFFAAFSVILHHIEQTKFWINDPVSNRYPNIWQTMFCDNIGHKGRIIFFVLSGFLITYLFLAEIRKTGTLNLRKFHTRRALRVWPVYILVVLFAFLILPLYTNILHSDGTSFNSQLFDGYWVKFAVVVLMLANFARFIFEPILGVTQLWSIAVQEQFYMVWPFLTRFFKNHFLRFVIVFIIFKVTMEILMKVYLENYSLFPNTILTPQRLVTLIKWWEIFAVDQLAIGALCAYLLINNVRKVLDFMYHPIVIGLVIILYVYLFFIKVDFYGHTFVEGVIAAVIMMNISTNEKFPVKLENRAFNYLGNISYGIYLFHNICIISVLNLLIYYTNFSGNTVLFNILLYLGSMIATLVLSGLSYKYVEDYFLRLKGKYEVIKSSRNEQEKVTS
ncbi:MAG: acyltransferase [Bacteroidetes bacterium]|nr:MAG: acyltransferase [Bacteroidota bacterium]